MTSDAVGSVFRSRGDVEEAGDEIRLTFDVMAVYPANLPLADHRHGLETGQRSARRSQAPEAKPGSDKTVDTPVILLDDVIQVFAFPQT
jgi:hypothetical protein